MKHGYTQCPPNPNHPPLPKWQGASSISILLLEFSKLCAASPTQLCHQGMGPIKWEKLQVPSTECFVIVFHSEFPPVP